MTRIALANAAGATLCLALSIAIALPGPSAGVAPPARPGASRAAGPGPEVVQQHGHDGILDAGGRFVALRRYARIASTSTLADGLLLALCEPDRIIAFTQPSLGHGPFGYRYSGKAALRGPGDLEALLALGPDLVLGSGVVAGRDRIARMRDAGLTVFDLGEMHGLGSLLPNIVTIATLLGRAQTGRELATRFEQRMRRLAAAIPERERPRGLYVSLFGDVLYGGTDGSSYHDVLTAAGIRDTAAERYEGWPRYTPEALLALDPELIVTHDGMARSLCAHPGLEQLSACRKQRIVELDGALLGDPGLAMLEAAESLFDAVHPTRPNSGP
jgi:iron complex transport system substrate-binding protein